MEELINLVAQKAGITTEQAQKAVETVVDFAKSKLPEPFASQVEGLLQGNNPAPGLGGLAKGLGGLFGGR